MARTRSEESEPEVMEDEAVETDETVAEDEAAQEQPAEMTFDEDGKPTGPPNPHGSRFPAVHG